MTLVTDAPAPTLDLDLRQMWEVSCTSRDISVTMDFPGDVHSALLDAGHITDPYWRDTEVSLDWVHEAEWIAQRKFDASPGAGPMILTLDSVDCVTTVSLNGHEVGQTDNRFRRYDLDVTDALVSGENTLEIRFHSNTAEARQRAKEFPFPVPYIAANNRLAHFNFLRKVQCDAGWDWNIALSPLGIYGEIRLREAGPVRLADVMVRQIHRPGGVTLETVLHAECTAPSRVPASLSIGEQTATADVQFYPGKGEAILRIDIPDPDLWWPAGMGPQTVHDVTVSLGHDTRTMHIGLRHIELITTPDEVGNRFAFRVNGQEIFAKGANWIPADALPQRATPEVVADLLDSAVLANMNMIRVWGGGTYEPDWFYEMCTERGLLVWQDFMFACNLYPAADRDWLDNVRTEARHQVRRLSCHPCVALWCGDNELVGALGWFDESRKDRDRYLAMYERLNNALGEVVAQEAPDAPWWPSSPSVGPLNFGDSWHDDTSGDMHFWDVWHSAKDFEHYRTVRPRFCSEFGFQSFPSPKLIRSFTESKDRNASSPVMDVHQRNDGGNSRIVETLARYFRFPEGFDEMCWLSQVSQGLAMQTAIEFWRSSKPRTMGTLYWQLNDTWPVASWSSLEYGGAWKLMHYMARRFYAPLIVTAQPDAATGDVVFWAVNDTGAPVDLGVTATRIGMTGSVTEIGAWDGNCPPNRAFEIARLSSDACGPQDFVHLEWRSADGAHTGRTDYLPHRFKSYDLPDPGITAEPDGEAIVLTAEAPAFFVTLDHGGADIWSDNAITLLPGMPRRLSRLKRRGADADPAQSLHWLRG